MGTACKQKLFQRRQTDGQQIYENILNIMSCKGNANQNQYENHLTLLEWLLQRQKITGTATMENSTEVPQKIKNRATIRPSNPSSGYGPTNFENIYL